MTPFSTKNIQFSPNQIGFRANMSCVHAVCEMTDYIGDGSDKRSKGNRCFLDLKKAFDTLDHDIFFAKNWKSMDSKVQFINC